jgi:hypothetical protein
VKHKLNEKPKETVREKSDANRRYVMVAEAYNAGETVQSLMQRYQVTSGTILDHLARYLAAGNKLRTDSDLVSLITATPEVQQAAFNAFDELSPTFLSPVFNKLSGAINYDDLKVLRMLYLITHQ